MENEEILNLGAVDENKMVKLPLAPFKRVFKEQGAEVVTTEAAHELRKITEAYVKSVAEMSVFAAKHGNRVTVQAKDVQLAVR